MKKSPPQSFAQVEFKRDNKNRPREMSSKKTVGRMVPRKHVNKFLSLILLEFLGGQIQGDSSSGQKGEKGPKVVLMPLMFPLDAPLPITKFPHKISYAHNKFISSQI